MPVQGRGYPLVMRTMPLVIGLLAAAAGGVFFLQGIGVLPGSYMTGDPTWAWVGGVMIVGGLALAWWARRR